MASHLNGLINEPTAEKKSTEKNHFSDNFPVETAQRVGTLSVT